MEFTPIVTAARSGDQAAQAQLYERTWQKLYYYALKMMKNPEDAMDAVQDSYMTAFSSLDKLENPEAFPAWLYRVCANHCKMRMRRDRRWSSTPTTGDEEETDYFDTLPNPDEVWIPETFLETQEKRSLILGMIDELPEAQRECVLLYYFEEMPVSEIASLQDCTEGTVKSRLNYARQKIKSAVLAAEDRDDIRLHSMVPLGFLLASGAADAAEALPGNLLWMGATSAATGTAVAVSAGGGSAAGAAKTGFLATLKAKIIAVTTAAAVVTSGAVAVHEVRNPVIHFESSAFEQNVRGMIGKPEGAVRKSDLEKIYRLHITEDGFAEFKWDESNNCAEYLLYPRAVPVDDFSDLKRLPDLNNLEITYDPEEILDSIPELEQLSMFQGGNMEHPLHDVTFLNNFPVLDYLSLYVDVDASPTPIEQMNHLVNLDLYICGEEHTCYQLNISKLENLVELDYSHVGTDAYFSYGSLKLIAENPLPELLSLEIYATEQFEGMDAVAKMPNLLRLILRTSTVTDFSELLALNHLRYIFYLYDGSEILDFSGFPEFQSLESFHATANYRNLPDWVNTDDETATRVANELFYYIRSERNKKLGWE